LYYTVQEIESHLKSASFPFSGHPMEPNNEVDVYQIALWSLSSVCHRDEHECGVSEKRGVMCKILKVW
jgi:hypothetical protein